MNLSQLVHSTRRLEREAKRAGILAEPPPPPLSDQEQVEHARLTALVDAHATEDEKATLDFSAMAGADVKFGWRLTDLAAAVSGEDLERPLPPFEWDPATLAEVTARIELRRDLRLLIRGRSLEQLQIASVPQAPGFRGDASVFPSMHQVKPDRACPLPACQPAAIPPREQCEHRVANAAWGA